jgi:hypothetical protein
MKSFWKEYWEEFVQGFKEGWAESTSLSIDLICAPFKAVYLVLKDHASRPL